MQWYPALIALVWGFLAAGSRASPVQTVSVAYDRTYDNPHTPLTALACSDGPNGLITKFHVSELAEVHHFPFVAGVGTVHSWNSPNCGKCYALSHNAKSIVVVAIDVAAPGTVTAYVAALNALTNGQAVAVGRINAAFFEIPC
ncbi:hypothetical protein HDU82_001270 [Entophlyctis luteolus]|nr:hypothetical protein HDU82_001270 [Entophlyctis luteolus]